MRGQYNSKQSYHGHHSSYTDNLLSNNDANSSMKYLTKGNLQKSSLDNISNPYIHDNEQNRKRRNKSLTENDSK